MHVQSFVYVSNSFIQKLFYCHVDDMITYAMFDRVLQSVANWGHSHFDTPRSISPMISIVYHLFYNKLPISK